MKRLTLILIVVILPGSFAVTAPAYAYLDPGTGSMLLQLLLGGVAGALVIGKLYWARIKSFFGRGPSSDSRPDPDAANDAK
jgi:hypothetical protein